MDYPYSVYFQDSVVTVRATTRSKARYKAYLLIKGDWYVGMTFKEFIKLSKVYKQVEKRNYGSDSFDQTDNYQSNRPWKTMMPL